MASRPAFPAPSPSTRTGSRTISWASRSAPTTNRSSARIGERQPRQFLAGNVTHLTGTTWPLAGTNWTDLYLSGVDDASVLSLNSSSLSTQPAARWQLYPFLPSEVTETDLHNTALVDSELDELGQALPR